MRPVFKTRYRLQHLSAGLWQWTRRRFTVPGLTMLGALIVAGLIGSDTDNNVAYQGFAVLFFVLLAALCSSVAFRARFGATRLLPRFGTAGCPLSYSVRVKNLTARPQAGLSLLEDLADARPGFQEWLAVQLADQKLVRSLRFSQRRRTNPFKKATLKEAPIPTIAPQQQAEVQLELTPLRRGILRFAGLTVACPDPLGLFRAFSRVAQPQTMLILPRRYPLPPIALPGTMKYQEGGVALSSSVGQSDEFVALRDYRHGDPLRHIHWRSWARAGKPVVKEFEDEFFVRHALVLDTFTRQPHSEAFEEAVSVAASFACTVLTQESLLDLLFVGTQTYCFTAGRGLAHADQMLEVLASVQPCAGQPFGALEHLVLSHSQVVSGCICILLAWDEARREFVTKLKALGLPVLVLVIVERGQNKSLDPGPLREQPDRFRVLEVGQIEPELAKLG